MSGGAEVLQEYLIKLGFVTDKVGLKKFGDGLDGISKNVLGVGTALVGMAVAAEIAVGKFASEMEDLHYTSKLADSSANSMKALEIAGKSVGIMGDTLTNGIKNLNFQLKDGTGRIQGLANSLGVQTKGRETADIYNDIALALRKMKDEQGVTGPSKNFANQLLGLDEESYQLLINAPGALEKYMATEKEQLAIMKQEGVDFNKLGEDALVYNKSLRELGTSLGRLVSIVLDKLVPAFKFLNDTTKGWIDILTKDVVINPKITNFFHPKSYYDKAKTDVKPPINTETSDDILFKKMGAFKESETSDDILFKKMGAFDNKKVTRGVRNKNPGNLNFAGQRGASKEGGANGRFAVFNTMEDGVNALDKQLQLYVNRDKLDTIAKIVNKYAPGNENNVPAYIKALEKETGLDANAKIDLTNPKVASSLRNGIIAHENAGYRLSSLDETKLGVNKSSGNASLVQNNTFNISGTDGHTMSKAVIAAQGRTNQDALRSLSTRVS